jgi:hypothetical protein
MRVVVYTSWVGVRMTAEERREHQEAADAEGITLSEYMRQGAVLKRTRHELENRLPGTPRRRPRPISG